MLVFATLYLISAFIYLYMGIFTISNDSHNPVNRIYLLICFIMFSWAGISVLLILAPDALIATKFRQCAVFAWGTLYSVLLHFFITLTGKKKQLKNPVVLLAIYLPAVYAIYLYFFQQPETAASIIKTSLGWVYKSLPNQGWVWDYYLTIYYLISLLISVILLWLWGKKSLIKREKKQAQIMIITILTAILLGSVTDIILPKTNLTLLPPTAVILCLIPISGIWYAMKKYRLMNLNYESLSLDILRLIDEGIIILNHEDTIVDVNQGALNLLGYPNKGSFIGEHYGVIFAPELDFSEQTSLNNQKFELKTAKDMKLPVLMQYLTLNDQLGDKLGSLISFQDISEITSVQDALEAAKDNLEILVAERTNELVLANTDLENEIHIRMVAEHKIKKLAFLDTLTNLPNRRLFDDRLEQAILKADRNQNNLALLYLDIDSFKHVNDTLGHLKGDKLLVEIASRLKKCIRKTDTLARVGGDEFIIILQDIKDTSYIRMVADTILRCFTKPFIIGEQALNVTTSIGISIYPFDGPDFETLVKNADAAMYKAKDGGKNKIELCTPDLKERLNENIRLTNSLYYAIERNELELYYQPQVNSRTNRIVGVEVLLRWHHPELGIVSPADFIPIAESSGLIIPIGEWVLNQACRQNKLWQDLGFEQIPISVNVSVKQFEHGLILANVQEILLETGLEPKYLELEITENIVMKDIESITKMLIELKIMGVNLAIDDFGTEYASLNYLKILPIDRIKIAMTFIRGICMNYKDEVITQAIILLAQNLNIAVIAEGVEKIEQIEFLTHSMCDFVQGYYYYQPMPREDFETLLRLDLVVDKSKLDYTQNMFYF
ncbi:MAG: EAL domain-containing protein [Clostridia bacterium]